MIQDYDSEAMAWRLQKGVLEQLQMILKIDPHAVYETDTGFTWRFRGHQHNFAATPFFEGEHPVPTHVVLSCEIDYLQGLSPRETTLADHVDMVHYAGFMGNSVRQGSYQKQRIRVPIALGVSTRQMARDAMDAIYVITSAVHSAHHILLPFAGEFAQRMRKQDPWLARLTPHQSTPPAPIKNVSNREVEEYLATVFVEVDPADLSSEKVKPPIQFITPYEHNGRSFQVVGFSWVLHPKIGRGSIIESRLPLSEFESNLITPEVLASLNELDWGDTHPSRGTSGWVHIPGPYRTFADPFGGPDAEREVEGPLLCYRNAYPVALHTQGVLTGHIADHEARVPRVIDYLAQLGSN